ncbi:MAG: 23S rRNA (pseudouridine(1915)-N(3))-methyltransferase RlmH [Gemmatimonadota bacterium]|nr:23S rRNA (pseudouridine(1915)-N(3))-methyltransferase RlmH [Gemmatimonadota bacterium]
MRFVLAAVGHPRDAAVASAIREYETRAARYWPLDVREVREQPARNVAPTVVREREGERLLAALAPGTLIVACDEGGRMMVSDAFADWLRREQERGTHDVAFLVGGAYGHGERVRRAASILLSVAAWTLPHDVARLVLAEQLYRAGTIVRREPYHKGKCDGLETSGSGE